MIIIYIMALIGFVLAISIRNDLPYPDDRLDRKPGPGLSFPAFSRTAPNALEGGVMKKLAALVPIVLTVVDPSAGASV